MERFSSKAEGLAIPASKTITRTRIVNKPARFRIRNSPSPVKVTLTVHCKCRKPSKSQSKKKSALPPTLALASAASSVSSLIDSIKQEKVSSFDDEEDEEEYEPMILECEQPTQKPYFKQDEDVLTSGESSVALEGSSNLDLSKGRIIFDKELTDVPLSPDFPEPPAERQFRAPEGQRAQDVIQRFADQGQIQWVNGNLMWTGFKEMASMEESDKEEYTITSSKEAQNNICIAHDGSTFNTKNSDGIIPPRSIKSEAESPAALPKRNVLLGSDKKSQIRSENNKPAPAFDLDLNQGCFPKPILTYQGLIALSLRTSKANCLRVAQIYDFICEYFPYYKTASRGWKSSIRHNLSTSSWYEKIGHDHDTTVESKCKSTNHRKSTWWGLKESCVGAADDYLRGTYQWNAKNINMSSKADEEVLRELFCGPANGSDSDNSTNETLD